MAHVPHTGGDHAATSLDLHEDALHDLVHAEIPPDTYLKLRGIRHYGTKKASSRGNISNRHWIWGPTGYPMIRAREYDLHWDASARQRVHDDIDEHRLNPDHFRSRVKQHVHALRGLSAVTPGRKDPADEGPGHVDVRDEVFPQEAAPAAKRLRLDEGGEGVHRRSTALARRGVHSQKVFY
jgi:hypothetical protein